MTDTDTDSLNAFVAKLEQQAKSLSEKAENEGAAAAAATASRAPVEHDIGATLDKALEAPMQRLQEIALTGR